MQKIQMDIPFRGKRVYLHGTDIYQFIVDLTLGNPSEGPFQLQFHSLLRGQGELLVEVEDLASWRKRPEYRGEGRFGPPGDMRQVVLVETDREVSGRKECNEREVAAEAKVDVAGRTAVLPSQEAGSVVERVVFLNKRLHSEVLTGVVGQWLFAKLELNKRLPSMVERELKLVLRQVLGNRFTKTEILIDDVSYGFIIFSTNQ